MTQRMDGPPRRRGVMRRIAEPFEGAVRRWREWRDARQEYSDSMEEMQFHIEQETQRNLRNGMSPDEARRAAARAFGGVDRFVEVASADRPRTRWTEFRMSYLDWKLGARMLRQYPGVSIVSVITLAAAIGLGAGWFEASMMMFHPNLPLEDGERIMRLEYWDAEMQDPELRTMHEFVQWRDELTSLEQIGAYHNVDRNLLRPGAAPKIVKIAQMSASGFNVAGVPPLLGRPLLVADEQQGSEDVVVIGFDAWQREFDGDRRPGYEELNARGDGSAGGDDSAEETALADVADVVVDGPGGVLALLRQLSHDAERER